MDQIPPRKAMAASPERLKATLDDYGTLTVNSQKYNNGPNDLHTQLQQVDTNAFNQQAANGTPNNNKSKKLFPQKLWDLINDEKYNFCLRWSDDGQLVYLNRDDFEDSYLKTPENQFHTQKAISFVRQMNMYGFRKVDDCYYENDNFKRNCDHLLKNMIRKHPNKNNLHSSTSCNDTSTSFDYSQQHVSPFPFQHHQATSIDAPFYQPSAQQTTLASSVAAAAVSLLTQPVSTANFINLQERSDYPYYTDCPPLKQFPQNFDSHEQQGRAYVDQNKYFQYSNIDDKISNEDSMSSTEDLTSTTTSSHMENQSSFKLDADSNLTAIYALLASLNTDLYQQQLANISHSLSSRQNIPNFNINDFSECHTSPPLPSAQSYSHMQPTDQVTVQNIPQKCQDTISNLLTQQTEGIVGVGGGVNYSCLLSDKIAPTSLSLLAGHDSHANNRGRHFKRKLRPLNLSLRRDDS